jgi:methyltransferase (TIGR00027 family)
MSGGMIESVSDTAFWIAHYRALETKRPDALFHDPLAARLAGERGQDIARAMPMPFMTAWVVVIRTCIIDDFIRLALAQGVDTVLNLGAGLDTRPYRMDLPESLLWIEADYPEVIDFKTERLSGETPRCRLERMKLDLTDLPQRRQLFESVGSRANRTLVLTEGVIPYFTVEEVSSLADNLKTLGHVFYWIVDYLSPAAVEFRQRHSMGHQNAPFKFKPKDWFGFFQEHGWRPREIRYFEEEANRLKRPIRLPLRLTLIFRLRLLLSSKERREAFKKLAGYVLLEPSA